MRILAIDTSSPRGSVAISVEERTSDIIRLEKSSSHLVELGKAVSTLLSVAGVGVNEIDRVAIVTGPGSFTGLRIGMAYVKGLYAARGLEVVVMTSLELLAHQAARGGGAVSPMIDARKDEVYAALYHAPAPRAVRLGDGAGGLGENGVSQPGTGGNGAPQPGGRVLLMGLVEKIAPHVAPPDEHLASLPRDPTVFVGSGAVRYRARIETIFGTCARFGSETDGEPDTRILCRVARHLVPLAPEDVVTLEPLYIRPSDVKLKPLKGVRAYDRR
jgi:tRNA threonylcarbamoyl adenosine modification protein YeaZ